jgi:hypothetical protein
MKKIIGLLGCGVILATSSVYGAVFFYQEPGQYVMAQAKPVQYVTAQTTNPESAVKPVLDISGIKEIQSIPVGDMRSYWAKDLVDEGEISMEQILDSIANLAVMQMGVEKFTIASSNPGEVIVGGEFGRVLKEILGFDPEREFDMSVEHTDFIQTDLGKADYYRLTINCRDIDLILVDCGTPDYLRREYGYDWSIAGLTLTQYSEKRDARGIPYTEERELDIHQVEDKRNPGRYKFMAIYTVRTLAPDGTVVEWEEWEFAQGSPNAISYRKIK